MKKGVLIAACLGLGGCAANVTHQIENANSKGIRYYETAPYVLIYSDGKGGLLWQIMFLPDQSHVMTASPQILGGRTTMSLKFQNGVLMGATSVGDTTEIPQALIAAVQSALPLLTGPAKLRALPGAPPTYPAPYLYKIVVKGDVVHFKGGQGDVGIQVPPPQGAGS